MKSCMDVLITQNRFFYDLPYHYKDQAKIKIKKLFTSRIWGELLSSNLFWKLWKRGRGGLQNV